MNNDDILLKILDELKEIRKEQLEIKQEQQKTNERLTRLETEQQQIKLAAIETNEAVKRLESIQESQQHIIELLSARSIQHEAELKRIK